MPRRTGRPVRVGGRLTEEQRQDLLYGSPFASDPAGIFDSVEARRAAWFANRAELMTSFDSAKARIGQKRPRGFRDFEDGCCDYPRRADIPRGLRIVTYEDCVERQRRGAIG